MRPQRVMQRNELVAVLALRAEGAIEDDRAAIAYYCERAFERVHAVPLRFDLDQRAGGGIEHDGGAALRLVTVVRLGLEKYERSLRRIGGSADDEQFVLQIVVVTDVIDADRPAPIAWIKQREGEVCMRRAEDGGVVDARRPLP